ncbi:MarR family winged helix-turn-helix transcriptional regulator [Saccharopolyspora shandongensis]|uniref:MarR family winged helix-turn-helix transcriptional regulator n=1 Tax=Saccharopolyspora shandongensis TaxID=418495 RepID=UPI003404B288
MIEDEARGPIGGVREEGVDRRTAAESVERELVMMFRRARNLSTTVAAHVHPDLDPASYSLLLMVDDAGPLRGMDVADRTGLDKSTVSRQIATLVDLDLLERVPDPDDGRARRIQLSDLGRERLAQVREERRKHLHGQFASWTTQDLKELARLLGKLNAMM